MTFLVKPQAQRAKVQGMCSNDCGSQCNAKCSGLGSCFCPLK